MTRTLSPLRELAGLAGVGLANFVPAGSEPDPLPSLYFTYTLIPGAVGHAFDGGGSYSADYQIDAYAKGDASSPDAVVRSVEAAEALLAALPRGLWLVLTPLRPYGVVDEQGYSRTMLVLRRFHSL